MNESIEWTNLLSECVVFVDRDRVDIGDLMPGRIIRCDGNPRGAVFLHVNQNDKYLGCVGGMVSDGE